MSSPILNLGQLVHHKLIHMIGAPTAVALMQTSRDMQSALAYPKDDNQLKLKFLCNVVGKENAEQFMKRCVVRVVRYDPCTIEIACGEDKSDRFTLVSDIWAEAMTHGCVIVSDVSRTLLVLGEEPVLPCRLYESTFRTVCAELDSRPDVPNVSALEFMHTLPRYPHCVYIRNTPFREPRRYDLEGGAPITRQIKDAFMDIMTHDFGHDLYARNLLSIVDGFMERRMQEEELPPSTDVNGNLNPELAHKMAEIVRGAIESTHQTRRQFMGWVFGVYGTWAEAKGYEPGRTNMIVHLVV